MFESPSASSAKSLAGGLSSLIGGPVGGFLTSALGGIFSARGAKRQQRQQQEFAREQMRFQERMSSTAYQRSAKDLEAAGLNRILALGNSASTPGGAMGTAQNAPALGVASAVSLRQATAAARVAAAQADKMEMENVPLKIKTDLIRKAESGVKSVLSDDNPNSALSNLNKQRDLRGKARDIVNSLTTPKPPAPPATGNFLKQDAPGQLEAARKTREHIAWVTKRDGKKPSPEYIMMVFEIFSGGRDPKTGEKYD